MVSVPPSVGAALVPRSAVLAFSDPYEYAAAIRGTDIRIALTSPGKYQAELTLIGLDKLRMSAGYASLPHVACVGVSFRRHPVFFLADERQKPKRYGGSELLPGELLFIPSGSENHQSTPGENYWCSMSLSAEDFPAAIQAVTGRDLPLPTKTSKIRPQPHLMERLQNLHKAARHLAVTAPDILARPEVARAIELQSVHALARCLMDGPAKVDRHRRAPVMLRFERFLADNPGRPLYLTEVCAAVGVSDRTLRLHCMEHLGMSPCRYLLLRRMNLARRALSRAGPAATTVTEIATDHGFWELGRFAVVYRQLFGESPSATLQAPHDQCMKAAQDPQFRNVVAEFA